MLACSLAASFPCRCVCAEKEERRRKREERRKEEEEKAAAAAAAAGTAEGSGEGQAAEGSGEGKEGDSGAAPMEVDGQVNGRLGVCGLEAVVSLGSGDTSAGCSQQGHAAAGATASASRVSTSCSNTVSTPASMLLPRPSQQEQQEQEPSFELPERLREYAGPADDRKALVQWRQEQQVGGGVSSVPGKVAALATWLGEARLRRWRGGAAVKRRRMQLASTAAAHHPPRPPGPTLVLVEKRRLEKARSMRTGSHAPTADADQHSTSLTSLPGGEAAAGEGAQEVDGGAAAAAARAGGQGEGGGAPWLGRLVLCGWGGHGDS